MLVEVQVEPKGARMEVELIRGAIWFVTFSGGALDRVPVAVGAFTVASTAAPIIGKKRL